MEIKKRLVLRFSRQNWDKPIVYKLIKDYNLILNILIANILPRQESYLVTEVSGDEKNFNAGLKYLDKVGVRVSSIEQSVVRNIERCAHCGACIAVCPTKSISIDKDSKEVKFDFSKCSACGWCVKVCPYNALEMFLMD